MKVITRKTLLTQIEFYLKEIQRGALFLYPTDTVYGLGCSAMNDESVRRIRAIKKRDTKPFSVIAPGKKWIHCNCEDNDMITKWMEKLPGPYTLILRLKNEGNVSGEVNAHGQTLGVRIPAHWFSDIVAKTSHPFVTTSANVTGTTPITSLNEISQDMQKSIDYAIDEGQLGKKASTVVDLTSEHEKILR